MSYQDYSQLIEISLTKIREFFIDTKIALVALVVSILLLLGAMGNLFNLYFNYVNWIPLGELITNSASKEVTVSLNRKITAIHKKHLFGKTISPGSTLADALKTNLPLNLKGVMSNINPKKGSAIIAGPDGVEQSYVVGDKIAAGSTNVVLEYIFNYKVYITNKGVLEYIEYPILDLQSQPPAVKRSVPRNIPGNLPSTLPESIPEEYIPGMPTFQNGEESPTPRNIGPPGQEEIDKEEVSSLRKKFKRFSKLKNKNKSKA